MSPDRFSPKGYFREISSAPVNRETARDLARPEFLRRGFQELEVINASEKLYSPSSQFGNMSGGILLVVLKLGDTEVVIASSRSREGLNPLGNRLLSNQDISVSEAAEQVTNAMPIVTKTQLDLLSGPKSRNGSPRYGLLLDTPKLPVILSTKEGILQIDLLTSGDDQKPCTVSGAYAVASTVPQLLAEAKQRKKTRRS